MESEPVLVHLRGNWAHWVAYPILLLLFAFSGIGTVAMALQGQWDVFAVPAVFLALSCLAIAWLAGSGAHATATRFVLTRMYRRTTLALSSVAEVRHIEQPFNSSLLIWKEGDTRPTLVYLGSVRKSDAQTLRTLLTRHAGANSARGVRRAPIREIQPGPAMYAALAAFPLLMALVVWQAIQGGLGVRAGLVLILAWIIPQSLRSAARFDGTSFQYRTWTGAWRSVPLTAIASAEVRPALPRQLAVTLRSGARIRVSLLGSRMNQVGDAFAGDLGLAAQVADGRRQPARLPPAAS